MPTFTADWVLTPTGLLATGAVSLTDAGVVAELGPAAGAVEPGLLIPGWVNAHCHLELSHLAGRIPGGEGMTGFARRLIPLRDQFTRAEQVQACAAAAEALWASGTAAVGDIANGDVSFEVKTRSRLSIYTFVEVFSLSATDRASAQDRVRQAGALAAQAPPPAALTPHAPYSCTGPLLEGLYLRRPERLSIHLLESREELEYLQHGTGSMQDLFEREWGLPPLRPNAPDPLAHVAHHLPRASPALFVHLTELTAQHRTRLEAMRAIDHTIYEVLCPRSNAYLHGRLPDFNLFDASSAWLCLGTDSLASCATLDLLDELKALTAAWPSADPAGLLQAATRNGARALGFGHLGELRPGARPRLLRLHPVSPEGHVTPDTRATVLG